MATLKLGSKGEEVKKLQSSLGLKVDGDFGPGTEKAVKEFQSKNGLTPDGIVGPKTFELINGKIEGVIYSPISEHITKSLGRKIKYLVIHYTAGGSSKKGAAMKNRNVFVSRAASADFCVDDETIVQVNPDCSNYYCWAVGDGKGLYGITNSNAISIEICSNLDKGTSAAVPNHTGWHFTEASLDNAVKLSKILMSKYNIPIENVVRHYDASRKNCPGIIGWNKGDLYNPITAKKTGEKNNDLEWIKFKKRLS